MPPWQAATTLGIRASGGATVDGSLADMGRAAAGGDGEGPCESVNACPDHPCLRHCLCDRHPTPPPCSPVRFPCRLLRRGCPPPRRPRRLPRRRPLRGCRPILGPGPPRRPRPAAHRGGTRLQPTGPHAPVRRCVPSLIHSMHSTLHFYPHPLPLHATGGPTTSPSQPVTSPPCPPPPPPPPRLPWTPPWLPTAASSPVPVSPATPTPSTPSGTHSWKRPPGYWPHPAHVRQRGDGCNSRCLMVYVRASDSAPLLGPRSARDSRARDPSPPRARGGVRAGPEGRGGGTRGAALGGVRRRGVAGRCEVGQQRGEASLHVCTHRASLSAPAYSLCGSQAAGCPARGRGPPGEGTEGRGRPVVDGMQVPLHCARCAACHEPQPPAWHAAAIGASSPASAPADTPASPQQVSRPPSRYKASI